jgi:hypothetical protein
VVEILMALNVTKEYNVLNECKYIRNQDRCSNDTNTGYEVFFNRDRAGWTGSAGMEVTWIQGQFLWCVVQSPMCYIYRMEDFVETFEADYFGEFEVDMLVRTDPSLTPDPPDKFTARIRWKTKTDVYTWPTDAYEDFDIIPDGIWHRYRVILMENPLWVGDCNNFVFYPMIDGLQNVEVTIKRMAFRSDFNYKCKQPACAANRRYKHPCSAIGTYARAYSTTRKRTVSVDDNNCRIGVSIDGYPPRYVDVDLSHASDPWTVAQSITMKLNVIGIGGYKYAECRYDPIEESFSIYTGTKGIYGAVEIYHGGAKDLTEEMGFFTSPTSRTWRFERGADPADGYLPNYYRIPANLLYRLPASTTTVIDYDPKDPLVEIGKSNLLKLPKDKTFPEGMIAGLLMIDMFGRCTYEGEINTVSYRGELASAFSDTLKSKIFLLRPTSDTSYQAVYSLELGGAAVNGVYSTTVNWDVRPGDVFGLFQCFPAVHGDVSLPPDKLYKYSWIEKRNYQLAIGDEISYGPGDIRFYGYEGLPVYGKSTATMLDIGIEAELKYEYGVSHVAVIGEHDSDYVIINLADLDTTMVTISTNNYTEGPVPAPESMYYIETDEKQDYFYIDFMFPGITKGVSHIRSFFENELNLRSFCWEWYVEPKDRLGFTWGAQYPGIETEAPLLGSEAGWRRMLDPSTIITDDEMDRSTNMYLMWNYVTDDDTDYFPGLTEDEQKQRSTEASDTTWTQLDQTFPVINTRGIRLNCWGAPNASINRIEIYSLMESTHTLLQAVEAFGISGPLVFDTETYNITNILGEKYSSSRISRAQTQDYIYGMQFELLDSDTAVAPVGTTMSKLVVNIGGLATRVEQIKIIPQHLAVRVTSEGDEPVEEITDLSWGMPSNGEDWTYGPVKSYDVCNDRGHESKLILGVADPLAIDQACVFFSKLNSYESLVDPYRGSEARLIEAPDYVYTNNKGINYRSIVYGIVPEVPVRWYSSTTSGAVWQTIASGSPFASTALWSEPTNYYSPEWAVYNWAKAENVSIISGSLNISLDSRQWVIDGPTWRNPTYFQSLDKTQYLLIETQIDGELTPYENVDSAAGIVLFDNKDRTKFVRIERYTGNGITASGYTQYSVPLDDYISYGDYTNYTRSGGFAVLDLGLAKKTNMLLRMAKEQNRVEVGYKTPWDAWTTVSSFDISDWSDDLRMGLFVGAVDRVGDASEQVVYGSFNYLAYKRSDVRKTDFFDYEYDFEDRVYTDNGWTAHNPHTAEILRTSTSGIDILKYIDGGGYYYFDNNLSSPAMETAWGSPRDYGTILFNLSGYNDKLLTSGNYAAGVLIRDSSLNSNYIQFNLRNNNMLEVRRPNGSDYFTLPYAVQPASGIWIRLHKLYNTYVPSYSYDGTDFTAVSGYSLSGWSQGSIVSAIFSTDLPEVSFSSLEIGTSQTGANRMAAEFASPISLYNVWGRSCVWSDVRYTASGTMTDFGTDKDTVKFISFAKSTSEEVDIDAVKFLPDPWKSKALGYGSATFEIPSAMEMLFDRSMKVLPEVGAATTTGTWSTSTASYKGLQQVEYPVLLVDLGRSYEIGRCPLAADNATGKFSRSTTGKLLEVSWDTSQESLSGFNRKCLSSSSLKECNADPAYGKPIITFSDGKLSQKYYAGPCDGRTTPAGATYKSCPLFSLGRARWMMLEYNNYSDITTSGGSVWFFAPMESNPMGGNYKLTDYDPWWVADYGDMFWILEENAGNEYALIYGYPGYNLEGSCFFNGMGSAYWRLPPDKNWTYEDGFSIDLRFWKPENLNSLKVRVGRDPKCYYEFTVTGTLSETWSTHSWLFKEGEMVIRSMEALSEPVYTVNDDEYYMLETLPYMPLPFINTGYVELVASGTDRSDIYFKNLTNTRTRFVDDMLFLGKNESLYIPELDLSNTGTIELDYYPSEAATNIAEGDPRQFLYSVLSVSNNQAGFSVVLHPYWGWVVYCHTPEEKYRADFMPTYTEAYRMLPTREAPGPFHLVLTWAHDKVPGRTDNVVLWVDGGEACSQSMSSIGKFFSKGNVKLTLGRGANLFDINEASYDYAAYAKFANLKVYKYPVPFPNAEIENEAAIPENLLELSLDGVNWAKFSDGTLPLISPNIPHGDCVKFYMRNKRPRRDIKELHRRHTAYLSVMWEVNQ